MEHTSTPLDAQPGQLYDFAGISCGATPEGVVRWVHPPGVYECIGIASDYRAGQEKVVYRGVGGRDNGKLFTAPFGDWADQFKRRVDSSEAGEHV